MARGARGGAKISSPNYGMIARAAGITLQSQGVTIGDLYEMRTLIEPPAARLVAERNSEKAVPILRRHLDTELSLVKDRPSTVLAIAEFHRLMIELAGNKSLIMFSQALAGLVEEHLKLANRRETETDVVLLEKRLRFGLRSHAKLIYLIETKDGVAAEAHWREHMIAAGKTWLGQLGPNSVVELLG